MRRKRRAGLQTGPIPAEAGRYVVTRLEAELRAQHEPTRNDEGRLAMIGAIRYVRRHDPLMRVFVAQVQDVHEQAQTSAATRA